MHVQTPRRLLVTAFCVSLAPTALAASPTVRTPAGELPAACVGSVPSGAHVDARTGRVTLPDGHVAQLPTCGQARPLDQTGAPPSYTPPDSWVIDSIAASAVPAVRMTSTFIVPAEPASAGDQTVFLFPGLRPSDGSSVLQPVLQWGNGTPSWMAGSWACEAISGGPCPNSDLIPVSPGDEMYGEIAGTHCQADGSCDWTITTTDKTTGKTTTLNFDNDGKVYTLLFGGVLESYGVASCGDYPQNGQALFTDVRFYDAKGNQLAPSWYPQYLITDYCKMTVKVTATATELDFPN